MTIEIGGTMVQSIELNAPHVIEMDTTQVAELPDSGASAVGLKRPDGRLAVQRPSGLN
jgi:hypothetical protein